jgi:hypothetical protein
LVLVSRIVHSGLALLWLGWADSSKGNDLHLVKAPPRLATG